MQKYTLSQSTIEKLWYYVYLLIDPRDYNIFYIGKGKWNRIHSHLISSSNIDIKETHKINTIREIESENKEVILKILRHWLTEKEALEIESAIIDLIGKEHLTNLVYWYNSADRGLMSLSDIKIKYEAEDILVKEPLLLININNLYHYDASPEQLYEYTRKSWKISINRVNNIKIICSIYRGIVREVFIVEKWIPSVEEWRYMFEWVIAPDEIRNYYLHKSVAKYWKQWSQNPIKDINP